MEGYIGQIILFSGTFAPKDWEFCEGGSFTIQDHPALFSVIGNAHGGDGIENFNLPKLNNLGPNLKYIICINGTYPQRS